VIATLLGVGCKASTGQLRALTRGPETLHILVLAVPCFSEAGAQGLLLVTRFVMYRRGIPRARRFIIFLKSAGLSYAVLETARCFHNATCSANHKHNSLCQGSATA
jgi:Na+-transporting methylmalonyl-CoA/oxaloacetate decarboxylase beta subunit